MCNTHIFKAVQHCTDVQVWQSIQMRAAPLVLPLQQQQGVLEKQEPWAPDGITTARSAEIMPVKAGSDLSLYQSSLAAGCVALVLIPPFRLNLQVFQYRLDDSHRHA